jgi:predicted NBD/HSP70 family sugar kinase
MKDRMHALGIDVTEHGARAVVVDGDGAIVRAADAQGADATAVVRDIVAKIAKEDVDAVGVAVEHGASERIGRAIADAGVTANRQIVPAASAAIAAEAWIGAAKGLRTAVCLVVGDRVLSGILLDGRPWSGAHGLAGAAGWLALNPVERQDYRKLGSLAAEVSSKGIARRLAWRIQTGDHSAVLEKAGDLESITAEHVYDGARAGDGVAISVVRDSAKYIGMAVANFVTTLDPEMVVLGGTLAAAGDLVLETVRHDCARWLPHPLGGHFRCELSPLGENGVAIGAARLALTARS